MKIKDLNIIKGKAFALLPGCSAGDDILLVRMNYSNSYALFNTKDIITFGGARHEVYKGVSEDGGIVNLSAADFMYPNNSLILGYEEVTVFPYDKCDDEDKAFLDNKVEMITRKVMKKASYRRMLEIS